MNGRRKRVYSGAVVSSVAVIAVAGWALAEGPERTVCDDEARVSFDSDAEGPVARPQCEDGWTSYGPVVR